MGDSPFLGVPASPGLRGVNFYHDDNATWPWNGAVVKAWMDRLPGEGVEWVQDNIILFQDTLEDTVVYPHATRTPTDVELIAHLAYVQSLGMHSALKMLMQIGTEEWVGGLGATFDAGDWTDWFASYQARLEHYADLAEANGVEIFCLESELVSTSAQEAHWRAAIAAVRAKFSGKLYVASSYVDYANIHFWDALDYLGTMGYFPLTDINNPTLDALIAGWSVRRDALQTWQAAEGKPVIFGEWGYSSADGTNQEPWFVFEAGTKDPGEQRDCYQAFMATFSGVPWIAGTFLWAVNPWSTYAGDDYEHNPFGKLAGNEILPLYWT